MSAGTYIPEEVVQGALGVNAMAMKGLAGKVVDAEALVHHQEHAVMARDAHSSSLTAALHLEMEASTLTSRDYDDYDDYDDLEPNPKYYDQERQNWMRVAMEQEAARVRAETERDHALRRVEMEERGRRLAEVAAETERAQSENARADAMTHADMVADAQERTRAYCIVTADLIERERVIVDSFRAREEVLLQSHPHPPPPPCNDPIIMGDHAMTLGAAATAPLYGQHPSRPHDTTKESGGEVTKLGAPRNLTRIRIRDSGERNGRPQVETKTIDLNLSNP